MIANILSEQLQAEKDKQPSLHNTIKMFENDALSLSFLFLFLFFLFFLLLFFGKLGSKSVLEIM